MPAEAKITPAIERMIRSGRKRGLSSAQIAALVDDRHRVRLDRSTITKYLAANPARPSRKRPAPPATTEAVELDELGTLRARARELHTMLQGDLSPGNVVKVNAELRQTFKSIRGAEQARQKAKNAASADAAWVLAKLKRLDAMNRGEIEDDASKDERLPEAAGAAGSR